MTDRTGEPWPGVTYLESPSAAARRRLTRPLIGAAVALALGVSFGFGVLALRNMGQPAEETAEVAATGVPVEIAAPQPPQAPAQPAPPLEVLPPDMAKSITVPAVAAPPLRAAKPFVPRADPEFSCRQPDTASERVVCGDAELARLDRGMNRAFDAAVKAGVPYPSLRQDQDDWLRVREDAARFEGPDGVAGMYRQRIAELREMAANFESSPRADN